MIKKCGKVIIMRYLFIFFLLFLCFLSRGQDADSEKSDLAFLVQSLSHFSRNIPQEKVYLHFDNTSYFQGDNIWFKCYIVTSAQHELSMLSSTLYVELLNPGGEVLDKRVLRIENGQCHGDFKLNHIPFYSGFYEVRAYTKYMLNFGDDAIFSRMLPVFDKPKEEGNHEDKRMLQYKKTVSHGKYPMKRENPEKGKSLNVRFFPEGGNPVQDIASRVAFEATDADGNPAEITGVVVDEKKQELCSFATMHNGRGSFTYTPGADRRRAIVEYSGKKYQFDLPQGLPRGVAMEVDNLTHPDSIGITLRKNTRTPSCMLGIAVLSGGKLRDYNIVRIADNETAIKMDKTRLPSGVSQIVLFNGMGDILCDRLIFTNKGDRLDIAVKTGKQAYQPYEPVDMEVTVTDSEVNPVCTTFSLSVRDGADEVEYKHNVMTDLLLMSEIKGYVRNPLYYFEDSDHTRREALDLLLMVQGWRRYSWKQMAGVDSFELKNPPEQGGIGTNGKIVSMVRQKPKKDVDVLMLLQKKEKEEEKGGLFAESFVTDSLGNFSFVSDVTGRWNMVLSVKEKGKRKDHMILLDKVFSPEPKRYSNAEMQINIAGEKDGDVIVEEAPDQYEEYEEDDLKSLLSAYEDSLVAAGISGKVRHMPEVSVTAKKMTKERRIYKNRSTSVAYYDVPYELDNIYDNGEYIGNDVPQMMVNINKDFHVEYNYLLYKRRLPLFVINYERTNLPSEVLNYRLINIRAIKSVYVSENFSDICHYVTLPVEPGVTCKDLYKEFSCIVFIETIPDGQIPIEGAKGVRKTWLEGYSNTAAEFYSPDYSSLPPEPDYRRTLYWNPSVTTDENGHANINFYNNSRCLNFSISAEMITPEGIAGFYKNE